MAARAGYPFAAQLVLEKRDEIAVLGVDLRQCAELAAPGETSNQVFIRQHQSVLIGEEELEARDPMLPHQGFHFSREAFSPPRHRHVEAVVDHGFLGGALLPDGERIERRLTVIRTNKIEDRRRAACCRRHRAGEEVIGDDGVHHRQLHMGVRIDPTRHHQTIAGVDDRGVGTRVESLAERGNESVPTQHIGAAASGIGDHRSATHEDVWHFVSPRPSAPEFNSATNWSQVPR